MRCFLLGFAGFLLAALLASIAIASYGDYSARASVSDTMQSVAPLQNQNTEVVISQGALANAGAALDPPVVKQSFPNADFLKVSTDGTIIFRSSKHGQIIVLEPAFSAGAVSWKCTGSKPGKNLPIKCR